MAREVELKYQLVNVDAFIEGLCRQGVSLSPPTIQCDTIFLRNGKSFHDLQNGESVIRIRQENGKSTVTIKQYVSGITIREEIECGISDAGSFTQFLRCLGFSPLVTVKKKRRCGVYRDTTITIDYVEGLGAYSEIETVVKKEALSSLRLIKDVAKELGLDNAHLVTTPYDEMLYVKGEQHD